MYFMFASCRIQEIQLKVGGWVVEVKLDGSSATVELQLSDGL